MSSSSTVSPAAGYDLYFFADAKGLMERFHRRNLTSSNSPSFWRVAGPYDYKKKDNYSYVKFKEYSSWCLETFSLAFGLPLFIYSIPLNNVFLVLDFWGTPVPISAYSLKSMVRYWRLLECHSDFPLTPPKMHLIMGTYCRWGSRAGPCPFSLSLS